MANQKAVAKRPVDQLKAILGADSVQEQFQNALKENSGAFVASIIDLYSSDSYLQQCDPGKVVAEALKAATLKLPINKSLGFAYIVPYRDKGVQAPQFQIGYKGYIQLAMRTGQYKYLNAGVVYEGEYKGRDKLTGIVDLSGEKTSDTVVGYFAYMELINGFAKSVYWTIEEVTAHAKKFSKSYNSSSSAWKTNFDSMAIKTVIRNLLSKYGIMSIDMTTALTSDTDDEYRSAEEIRAEVRQNANTEVIDTDDYVVMDDEPIAEPDEPEQAQPTPDAAPMEEGQIELGF